MKRTSVRLVVIALFFLVLIVILFTRPAAHDPLWWRHAGIKERIGKIVTDNDVVFGEDGVVFNNRNAHHQQQHQGHDDARPKGDVRAQGHNPLVKPFQPGQVPPYTPEPPAPRYTGTPKPMAPLVRGVHYYSDYDVDAVKLDPEPPIPSGKKLLFNYIEPSLNPEYPMKYVSNKPRVLMIQDFLTPEECDAIIAAASKSMFRSQVAPTLGSKDKSVQDVRTSSQAWLHAASDPARPIVERILKLVGFPPGSNEELQVLRYEVGQKYDAHNDYFDPKMYGPQATNRALTFYLYLSDVEEGGETWFPRADGKSVTFDFTSCSQGFRVRPKKGWAAIFYDMKPDGELDPYSLHGACPVKKGTKWGGTLWLRMPTPSH